MTMITAIGMTLLIIGGEVDLSVGSMQAFVGVVAMQVLNAATDLWAGIGVATAIGVIVGLVNAGLTLGLGINSFIVTLAMFSIIRGLAYTFTDAAVQNEHKLESFKAIGTGFIMKLPVIGRIPWPVVITAVIFAVFSLVLTRTTIGRYIYAVGGNARAAALSGVRVKGVKTLCFMITSVLAAVSAFILISRLNSGQNNAGFGFELQVIGGRPAGRGQPGRRQGHARRHPAGGAAARHPQQRHRAAGHQLELAAGGQRADHPDRGPPRRPPSPRAGSGLI